MKGYDEIRGQQFRLAFDEKSRSFELQPLHAVARQPRRKTITCVRQDLPRTFVERKDRGKTQDP